MELTEEQTICLNKLNEFLNKKKRIFLLTGAAGTGKTTIISKFICNTNKNINVCAPTHKAKKILKEKIDKDIEIETLHSFLGMRKQISPTGKQYFSSYHSNEAKQRFKECEIVIIDESSMINRLLYDKLKDIYNEYKHIKIIFLGDIYQLPPVNEKQSPVFKHHIPSFDLKEIIRNDGAIEKVCKYLRTNIEENSLNIKPFIVDKVFGFGDHTEWISQAISLYKDERDTMILTWTNRASEENNNIVRKIIYGEDAKELYCKGERLIATDFVITRNEKTLYTCDQMIVDKVKKAKIQFADNYEMEVYVLYIDDGKDIIYKQTGNQVYKIKKKEAFNLATSASNKYSLTKSNADKQLSKQLWGRYYKFINTYDPAITYNYSTTVHKSQGSTCKYVFIDYKDIIKNRNVQYRNQCLYTALSRASKALFILN